MQGHKFKMAHDQDWRAVYEKHTWIPEDKIEAGGDHEAWGVSILELCGSLKWRCAVMWWSQFAEEQR